MASESAIGLEYPILVIGGDGTTIWQGCGFPDSVVRCINNDTVNITPGLAVVYKGQAIMDPRSAVTVAPVQQTRKVVLSNTTGSLDRGYAGVALNKAPAGGIVLVGEAGLLPVVTVSQTQNVAGAYITGSSTAGQVIPTNTIPSLPAGQLGKVAIGGIAGTTGGTTDSGSATLIIGIINPS